MSAIPSDVEITPELVARFLSHVIKRPDGHWEWTAKRGRGGHGLFRLPGRYVQAHRMSWWMFSGPIPEGLLIRHLPPCHFGWCVNPDHLTPGTTKENVADRVQTWMYVPRKPDLAYLQDLLSKLTEELGKDQVVSVLQKYLSDKENQTNG